MLRGFATVNYFADDLEAAKAWYAQVLGVEAYFEVPGGYAEFRVGDSQDELGIIDRRWASHPTGQPAGQVIYWHVDELEVTLKRLIALGATEHEGVRDRGHGFVTASVIDPFGNILGVMYNPHYVETLNA